MLHLYDRATMAHALTLDLEPRLRSLLADRINSLVTAEYDLTDQTEFLVVEPDDTEENIICAIGFSPLVEPIDGIRFGEPTFIPWWDCLLRRDGWFEMVVTFGSTFSITLFIANAPEACCFVSSLCERYTT